MWVDVKIMHQSTLIIINVFHISSIYYEPCMASSSMTVHLSPWLWHTNVLIIFCLMLGVQLSVTPQCLGHISVCVPAYQRHTLSRQHGHHSAYRVLSDWVTCAVMARLARKTSLDAVREDSSETKTISLEPKVLFGNDLLIAPVITEEESEVIKLRRRG